MKNKIFKTLFALVISIMTFYFLDTNTSKQYKKTPSSAVKTKEDPKPFLIYRILLRADSSNQNQQFKKT